MKNYKLLSAQEVNITTKVKYEGLLGDSKHKKNVFSYVITVKNNSVRRIKLMSRKWLIMDSVDGKHTVEGEGVVGQKPELEPGQSFTYDSWCPIEGQLGEMSGYYYFIDMDTEEQLMVEIPRFSLILPAVLN